MGNNTIFYTQISSIIIYVGTVFFIYRLYVRSKDATIETLREEKEFLKTKIDELEKNTPGNILKRFSERINILENEINRLSEDKEKNKKLIEEKKGQIKKLKEKQEAMKELYIGLVCPICEAPLTQKSTEEYWGREGIEGVYEIEEYECGTVIVDGDILEKCDE
ncbi:MAG: hypothetical protein K9K32_07500 [Halanaerobiales bacterium]|nr:hypothetical protein [Halanaerobiales bacterium]